MIKLVLVDLDGTLFDTKLVNYKAYQQALKLYGYELDYQYFCNDCNGKNYKEFLPSVIGEDKDLLKKIHKNKKDMYSDYLEFAKLNNSLMDILRCLKPQSNVALITTASLSNAMQLLSKFNIDNFFDLIIAQEDVCKLKPDPEGYNKALQYFRCSPEDAIVFEDSQVGIQAAENANIQCFVVKGYN